MVRITRRQAIRLVGIGIGTSAATLMPVSLLGQTRNCVAIGTAGQGGVFYPLGTGLAHIISAYASRILIGRRALRSLTPFLGSVPNLAIWNCDFGTSLIPCDISRSFPYVLHTTVQIKAKSGRSLSHEEQISPIATYCSAMSGRMECAG